MSSHLKNLTGSAGKMFSRAQQYTEEILGQSEKTQYDQSFESLMQTVEKNKIWTERILDQIETIIHPNPGEKIEEFIMSKIGQATKEKPNSIEVLSQLMKDASVDLVDQGKLAETLVKIGDVESTVGMCLRERNDKIVTGLKQPLKSFIEVDYKNLQKEKKSLETLRLDLDSAKSKVKRAKPENKASADAELQTLQITFDRQLEVTKILLDQLNHTMIHTGLRSYVDLIDIEHDYHSRVVATLAELKKEISLMPVSSA
ncbi:hypothetical protein GJ496_003269 [Pomphorhynchus laevis]|nr:hypothetical protein GJ496_003269 [Pomphorhynchus laevis]